MAAALPLAIPPGNRALARPPTFDLKVTGAGQPLVDAEVELYLVRQGGGNATAKERTDAAGWARPDRSGRALWQQPW